MKTLSIKSAVTSFALSLPVLSCMTMPAAAFDVAAGDQSGCEAACYNYGGWTGNWSEDYQDFAGRMIFVCGCRAKPVDPICSLEIKLSEALTSGCTIPVCQECNTENAK